MRIVYTLPLSHHSKMFLVLFANHKELVCSKLTYLYCISAFFLSVSTIKGILQRSPKALCKHGSEPDCYEPAVR